MAPKTGSWKPQTLKAPILGGFIVVSIVLIAVIEYLSQRAKRDGALVFAQNVDSLPESAKFGYLFLPTIIAVVVTMFWTWIDLDAKRLEPWFQLSKNAGAKAENSLLLQYPFVFAPFAPFVALRRKHWAVVSAATVTVLFLWLVVPFQSAIFNTATLIQRVSTQMQTTSALFPLDQQAANLDYNMYFDIFGVVWNRQKVLQFTTPEYAVLPFRPTSSARNDRSDELWSMETQAFSTSLDCKEPKRTPITFNEGTDFESHSYRLEHNSECSIDMETLFKPSITTYIKYRGYWEYGQKNDKAGLGDSKGCSSEVNKRTFMAIATTNSSFDPVTDEVRDFTALFCTPKYHVQTINVTVNASSLAIVNMTTISDRTDMPANLFNTTHLEYLISTSTTVVENREDKPLMLIQGSKMFHAGVFNDADSVAFAVGLNQSALPDIMKPDVLSRSFEQMHQLLFSQAFSTLTTGIEDGSMGLGVRINTSGAIVLVRAFAIVVETGLALVIIMTTCLWFITFRRKSKLPGDPSSIGNMLALTPYVGKVVGRADGGAIAALELEQNMKGKRFQLVAEQGQTRLIQVDAEHIEVNNQSQSSSNQDTLASQTPSSLPPVSASGLSLLFGLFLLCIIGGLMATLISLQEKTKEDNGIKLPTTNRVALSILTNFIPTLFATLLEPIWLSMNRLLAMLRPFEELRVGSARYFRSIGATYSSLPPPFVIWRALRSHHFVLVGVCFATISTNVLAVAFAGIFEENIVGMAQPLLTNQILIPTYTGRNIINLDEVGEARNKEQRDHLYYADSNLTRGNNLPAWVDQDYYYLPFGLPSLSELHNSSAETFQGFRASTYGLGVDVSCKPMTRDAEDFGVHFEPNPESSEAEFWTSHIHPNSSKILCESSSIGISVGSADMSSSRLAYDFQGVMASQIEGTWDRKMPFCTDLLVLGWVRLETEFINKTTSARRYKKQSGTNHTGEGTFLGCVPKPRVAKFDIVVDSEGFILHSNKLFDVADSDKFFDIPQVDINPRLPFAQFKATLAPGGSTIRNSSTPDADDWVNKFLNSMRNSTTLTDPAFPPPLASEIAPKAEALYRQLFALVLVTNAFTVFKNTTADPIPVVGAILINETRLFLNPVMYRLSLAVLAFHFYIAVLFYLRRPRMFLHRLPTNIASVLAFLDASRVKEEFIRGGEHDGGFAAVKEQRFGYGNFEGLDGKVRAGIEVQQYVITPDRKKGIFSKALDGVFGKGKSGVVVETRELGDPGVEKRA